MEESQYAKEDTPVYGRCAMPRYPARQQPQCLFLCRAGYLFYLDALADACQRHSVALHAYVLMTNHVHLLLSPDDASGVPLLMQSVGRRYVQYINRTYRRSGTLWEGRYKASLVDAESYLLACYRYIEMNPVTAGMVDHPAAYRWSSYGCNAGILQDTRVTPHCGYWQLGKDQHERSHNYRELFSIVLPKDVIHRIRNAAQFSAPLGTSRFAEEIEIETGVKTTQARRGRPAKAKENIDAV